ncbi:hypothetical protein CAEBREN_03283 [Caenorhabditis brenneri]|uniref:Uncharacterized protein n=1 Tax=Caenorhabditis brenneri TaxID=135651 RepID=G0MXN8_CAEBE|nr:hypothetical protein CAEBREN_03283 [Caenorhabditis brenneri]
MGLRQLARNFAFESSLKASSSPTLKQLEDSRQKIKTDQDQEVTSNNHIISWLFFCLYFIPFIAMIFVALCSFGNAYRNELGHFANPSLKDIEHTLVMEMRKNEEAHVSLKKKMSKQKSEIIDVAVTTTSQMGNITDLGSEGPTGPSGGSSSKTIKKDTALKSLEETKESKDSTGDAPI